MEWVFLSVVDICYEKSSSLKDLLRDMISFLPQFFIEVLEHIVKAKNGKRKTSLKPIRREIIHEIYIIDRRKLANL